MALTSPVELDGYPDDLKPLAPFGPFRAAVSRVVDGDTVYAVIDVGFNTYSYQPIRVADIDTPEIFSGDAAERQRGMAARDYLEELLALYGRHVVLHSEKYTQSFGRYVAHIILSDGSDLGRRMVDAGHAVR